MKKLVILPVDTGAEEGYLGQLADGSYYPYSEVQGTASTWFDIHLVDTNETVEYGRWFINAYGHINLIGYCDADQIHTGSPNEVIIASTQRNLNLPTIPQFIIDKFLENTEMDWLVDYDITETGEYVTLCSSDSCTNEWENVDTHLDLNSEEAIRHYKVFDNELLVNVDEDRESQNFEIFKYNEKIRKDFPIQDEVWASRRWNLSKTDYCDLSDYIDDVDESMIWWNSLGSQAQYLIGLHYDVTTASAIKDVYELK